MTDPTPDVKSLFGQALERPASERAAFLDAACAGHPAVREELDALLGALDQARDFLKPLAPPVGDGPTVDVPAGESVRTGSFAAEERPGVLIAGRYKLLQQIGEGGMGSVWMADQIAPVKRRVAVKLIRDGRGDSKAILSRFEAERQAIALMDHPHIAKLLDAGTTEDGHPFFVMELVKGVPLTDYCDAHRLSIPDRLALFQQICGAVQHAHQKGVIHRDLKPTNILVESHDGKPVPKVIDFGLAKATTGLQLTDHTLFTAFGSVLGTPLYMAPEQATFNAVDVDTRADVYALGVVLYELLTGTTPLTRETVKKAALDEMLKLIREQEAPTPSSRLSTAEGEPAIAANRQAEPGKLSRMMKGELDWIVLRALAKERERRYESAAALARDVGRHLSGDAVEACPPTLGYRLKKAYRRNRAAVLVTTMFSLVVMVGIVVTSLLAVHASQNADAARRAEAEAVSQREAAVERGHTLRRASYVASIGLAAASWEAGNLDHTRHLLEQTSPGTDETDLRGFEWHYLRRAIHQEAGKFDNLIGTPSAVAYNPDGRFLAALCAGYSASQKGENSKVIVWNLRTGKEAYRAEIAGEFGPAISYSPDGKLLVAAGYSSVIDDATRTHSAMCVWDAETGHLKGSQRFDGEIVKQFAIAKDGKTVVLVVESATVPATTRLRMLDTETVRELPNALFTKVGNPHAVAFNAAGEILVGTYGMDEVVRLRNLSTGMEHAILDAQSIGTEIGSVFFSPSGNRLGVATRNLQLRVWDLGGDHPTLIGTTSAYTTTWGSIFALSPDGNSCVVVGGFFADNLVTVWDVKDGRILRKLRGHSRMPISAAFSPVGGSLATGGQDCTVRTWDLPRLKTAKGQKTHDWVSHLAGRPDGGFSIAKNGGNGDTNATSFVVEDLATRQTLFRMEGGDVTNRRTRFHTLSPDSRWIAMVVSDSGKWWVQVQEIGSPTLKITPSHDDGPYPLLHFHCNDKLVIARQDSLVVWDLTTGKTTGKLSVRSHQTISPILSANGRVLAAVTEDSVLWLWDTLSGDPFHKVPLPVRASPNCLTITRDGALLACGEANGQVLIYDVKSGRHLHRLYGHAGDVHSLIFSPDGSRLYTCGADRCIKIWDPMSGRELITVRCDSPVHMLAMSADGKKLAVTNVDGDWWNVLDATPLPEAMKRLP